MTCTSTLTSILMLWISMVAILGVTSAVDAFTNVDRLIGDQHKPDVQIIRKEINERLAQFKHLNHIINHPDLSTMDLLDSDASILAHIGLPTKRDGVVRLGSLMPLYLLSQSLENSRLNQQRQDDLNANERLFASGGRK